MNTSKAMRRLGLVILALVVVGLFAAGMLLKHEAKNENANQPQKASGVELRGTNTVIVPQEVIEALGIKTRPVKQAEPRALEVFGQLVLPQDHLARVRLRFAGRVVRLGEFTDHAPAVEGGVSITRELRVGDTVDKGQLLAVVYSADLGQKKSDLVDRLTTLHSDERVLREYQKITGAMPPRTLWQQTTQVQQDRIAVNTAEATLRALDVSPEEIAGLRQEADRVHRAGGEVRSQEQFDNWARVEIRAPAGWRGTILEKNASADEYIDPSTNPPPLFQIADLSHMIVDAWASEDALRVLDKLSRPMHWTVRLMGEPPGEILDSPDGDPRGPTFQILPIIDPNQKSPILRGMVKTPGGRLLAGMPVKAAIPLESPADEVAIAATALVDDGDKAFVFIQDPKDRRAFSLRRVSVCRRYEDVVTIGSQRSRADRATNGEPSASPFTPLISGQEVMVSGALEVREEMRGLQAKESKKE